MWIRRLSIAAAICAALAGSPIPASGQAQEAASGGVTRPGGAMVNINAASAEQLESLPGIGASTAARIVEYRQKNGPFRKIEDLMNVRGIGEKSFLRLKPLLSVGPAKPEKAAPTESR